MSSSQPNHSAFEQLLFQQTELLMRTNPVGFLQAWEGLAKDALRFFGLERLTLFPNSMILVNTDNTLQCAAEGLHKVTVDSYIDSQDRHLSYLNMVEQAKEPLFFSQVDLAKSDDFVLRTLHGEGGCWHCVLPLSLHGERWGALAASAFSKSENCCQDLSPNVSQLRMLGNLWLSHWQHAKVLNSVRDNVPSRSKEHQKVLKLSKKQVSVLSLLAQGYSAKQAGKMLNLSPRTIESHKYRLMQGESVNGYFLHSPRENPADSTCSR